MRIVFMGTPDFAVESLKVLVENNYEVVGVVTMPDKPAGRGHKIQYSPVKNYALEHNLPLLQPEKLKDDGFLEELRALKADLQIVVAFRMLPEVVWNMPEYGTFNLHASLLPQYRGAAPINWAIINGEKETGATTFFLTHEIDTGKIILQEKIPVTETDNAGSVHDKLMVMGAGLVKRTVDLLIAGQTDAIDQSQFIKPETELTAAPKIFKETCEIDLNKGVEEVYNFIRGLSPYPAAWVNLRFPNQEEQITLKIFETEKEFAEHTYQAGEVITDGKRQAKIALKDGFIVLKSVQAPGKKRMEIGEMLRGMR
ncbi:methionyl-tRNA formyltransferase [Paludibacter sp. 221]|uniref:methionyl-tRNA formyltransferase n=1 Tax=Paludibacter sp. 221 TaxID=2302939 RepID=UPI0013CFCDDA|nr:methionyl-tRNA formyltransferase [Paludibacter sp. 221]NDV46539.1 methionyl-tRNA formyltransferase [Paludibacter sp. 221]